MAGAVACTRRPFATPWVDIATEVSKMKKIADRATPVREVPFGWDLDLIRLRVQNRRGKNKPCTFPLRLKERGGICDPICPTGTCNHTQGSPVIGKKRGGWAVRTPGLCG